MCASSVDGVLGFGALAARLACSLDNLPFAPAQLFFKIQGLQTSVHLIVSALF
jgi:hypothetical protein